MSIFIFFTFFEASLNFEIAHNAFIRGNISLYEASNDIHPFNSVRITCVCLK